MLARTGAIRRAWAEFTEAGLDKLVADPEALTLKGRLLKDRARMSAGDARARLFLQSAKAYAAAAKLHPDSYPLINAATMSLFAGEHRQMEHLAREVLDLQERGAGIGETPYWHEATRAEALLLLGQGKEAETALANAVRHAPMAWEDHATSLRQFREISSALNIDIAWLSRFSPPPSLHFGGMMGIAPNDENARHLIADRVMETGPGFAFGALAAGADILIAETLMTAKADLHLILPARPHIFKSQSVEPYGGTWGQRFDRICGGGGIG